MAYRHAKNTRVSFTYTLPQHMSDVDVTVDKRKSCGCVDYADCDCPPYRPTEDKRVDCSGNS